ncbi:MAG TPA: 2-oxoglutarate dehydrogenase complex dihydrolipoyllysine-residue succinyltransferase, partial [Gemmataceae bacterium]|nr:2-oxoglutarate dehydrogenase complex dihydrolipoyllysine-residue succinyltransferase [Gemmataceae bacterium]
MAVEIKVPSVGESVTEATVGRWLKPNGAAVRADEPVCELETDKATTEVMAPAAGTLAIQAKEGQKVSIGAVIGRVEAGAPAPAKAASNNAAPPPPKREESPRLAPAAPPVEVPLSPSARRLIADKGIDARDLTGTGRGGRITKEDVLGHLSANTSPAPAVAERPAAALLPPEARPQPAAAPPKDREVRQRMSPIRQRIAERLLAAQQNAAILTTFNEVDMSAVMALRAKYKESFQKKHGVGLGFMGFFVKAVVEALRAFPAVNARIDGGDVVYQNYYDVGVAVSTERGLLVPVLRDADGLSFAGVEKGIAALAQKAREGKIGVADLQGGTFTITNGGVFGSLLSTPILNPPQSGILGMHAIQKRPVAVDDQVVVRPMMYLA